MKIRFRDESWIWEPFATDCVQTVQHCFPRVHPLLQGLTTMQALERWQKNYVEDYHGSMRSSVFRVRDDLEYRLGPIPRDEWTAVQLAVMEYSEAACESLLEYEDRDALARFYDASRMLAVAFKLESVGVPDSLADIPEEDLTDR